MPEKVITTERLAELRKLMKQRQLDVYRTARPNNSNNNNNLRCKTAG